MSLPLSVSLLTRSNASFGMRLDFCRLVAGSVYV